MAWEEILGSIAGDDTVLLITRGPTGGQGMADLFLTMGRTTKPPATAGSPASAGPTGPTGPTRTVEASTPTDETGENQS